MNFIYKISPKKWLMIAYIICMLLTLCLLPFLPNDLPMQFSNSGSVNWSISKYVGVWIIPVISMFLCYSNVKENRLTYVQVLKMTVLLMINLGFLMFIAVVL